jgi:hypothetical protein
MNLSSWYKKQNKNYTRSTSFKFIYRTPGDLQRKTKRVAVAYLVYSVDDGYEIFNIEIKRKDRRGVKQWLDYIKDQSPETETAKGGWHNILITKVLPAASVRRGSELVFKDLLAWRNDNDISNPSSTASSSKHKAKHKRK